MFRTHLLRIAHISLALSLGLTGAKSWGATELDELRSLVPSLQKVSEVSAGTATAQKQTVSELEELKKALPDDHLMDSFENSSGKISGAAAVYGTGGTPDDSVHVQEQDPSAENAGTDSAGKGDTSGTNAASGNAGAADNTAAGGNAGAADNADAAAVDGSTYNVDWFAGMKDVTEEELQNSLDVTQVESASLNTLTGNLFIIMKNGDTYRVTGVSQLFVNYLQMRRVDVAEVEMAESEADEEMLAAESRSKLNRYRFTVAAVFGGLFALFIIIGRRHQPEPDEEGNYPPSRWDRVFQTDALTDTRATATTRKSKNKVEPVSNVPKVRFSDVEGVEELKTDIMRLVDCLKYPEKYSRIGARTPKGVILYGPPGTGKTLLAKAIAGEADVPFFSAVGSDFVEMYVGLGASRVRQLYAKARKAAPCIVFIDEIDAVAGKRGRDNNTERDQTINAMLAELDGFKDGVNVLTICATNRLEMLDDAFTRAGRFDLKLAVGLPDRLARLHILQIHGKNKRFFDTVDFNALAVKTTGFSGAELEALLNESAMIAVGRGKEAIDNDDIDDAYFKIVLQGNKKRREEITEVNRIIAWHEAGHTLATKLLTDDRVPTVTIVGCSSGAGGVTFRTPKQDQLLQSKKYLENTIQIMYAGRAAEELYMGDKDSITTGASQDIQQATSVIKNYLAVCGMGNLGMIDLSQFRYDYSDIVEEASALARRLYDETLALLTEHRDKLEALAEELLQKETLNEAEINALIGMEPPEDPLADAAYERVKPDNTVTAEEEEALRLARQKEEAGETEEAEDAEDTEETGEAGETDKADKAVPA